MNTNLQLYFKTLFSVKQIYLKKRINKKFFFIKKNKKYLFFFIINFVSFFFFNNFFNFKKKGLILYLKKKKCLAFNFKSPLLLPTNILVFYYRQKPTFIKKYKNYYF